MSQDELVGEPPPKPRRARPPRARLGPGWVTRSKVLGSLVFADVGWDPSQRWPTELLEQLTSCHAFLPNADEAMGYTRTDTPTAALSRIADLVPLAVVTLGLGTVRSRWTARPVRRRPRRD